MTVRRPFPDPGSLIRARALLLDAQVPVPVGSWDLLATLCDTGWLPVTRRPSAAAARVVRRRLRRLVSPPLTVARATPLPRGGEILHVRGVCASLATAEAERGNVLWRVETIRDEAGSWLVEEQQDFALTDPDGGRLYVLAAGGRLVSGALHPGDEVSVFGVFDDIPDRAGLAPSTHRRGGLAPALRSGCDLPLLVSLIRRYAEADVPRQ